MAKPKGSVRTSQLVTTYGVGSVVALGDESFMVAGMDRWPVDQPNLFEPRLERILNARGFVRPPSSDDGSDVPVVRFPKYHFCPECHRLEEYQHFGGTWLEAKCAACDSPLVPARFVMVCERGHIDDFPWFRWIHAGSERTEGERHRLSIRAAGVTSSLADILVSCACGRSRTLDGAFGKAAMRGVTPCTGRRPWMVGEAAKSCDQVPRALQRGASNVWFSSVRSAISIPPWSEGAYRAIDQQWHVLRHLPDDAAIRVVMSGLRLAEQSGIALDDLVEAVASRKRQEAGDEVPGRLKDQELEALRKGKPDNGQVKQDFVCEPVRSIDPELTAYLSRVSNVSRLREVRVLEAFTRLLPPNTEAGDERQVQLLDPEVGLLPGIEVIGEGVFLELDADLVSEWEQRDSVVDRAAVVAGHYEQRCTRLGITPTRTISARFLLVHTFAHALITQWSFDSGYSASSLRERLYVTDDAAAMLIYTATSDSAGSLGGVISQTRPSRFLPGLRDALRRSAWCSADPLCIEAGSQGADALNLGACHACALLPETSCEEMNVFLDRAMVVGTPDDLSLGLFSDWL